MSCTASPDRDTLGPASAGTGGTVHGPSVGDGAATHFRVPFEGCTDDERFELLVAATRRRDAIWRELLRDTDGPLSDWRGQRRGVGRRDMESRHGLRFVP